MSSPATYRAFSTEQFGRARDVLAEVQLPLQAPAGRDLRVRVRSGAINPVDVKVLHNFSHATGKADKQIVPGWDAAGVVEAVGEGVQNFKVGDEVVFAGVISRHGSFGEAVLVDERIVGKKPRSLSWDQAAAFPLTMLTAWEGLVEELGVPVPATSEDEKKNAAKSLLVIAGAGGVGSQAIQLAKHLLKIGKVVATASRPETIAYCKSLGADFTVSHREPLLPQLKALGLDGTNFIFNCDYTDAYIEQMVAIVLPFGGIVNINDPKKELALGGLFAKRASIHFELMFSRALFNVEPERQGAILNAASELFDKGVLKSTLTKTVPFTREGLVEALELQESGTAIGKIAFTVKA